MPISFTKTHYLARIHRFDNEPIVLCEEMLSCSISRNLENPAHSFSISIIGYGKVGEYYRDNLIKSDDWIEIFHAIGPKEKGTTKESLEGIPVNIKDHGVVNIRCKRRFLGRIERFERETNIDGVSTTRFSLTGSSWGKTIVSQPSMVLPYFEGGVMLAKFIKSQYKITDTPDKTIRKILDFFWANQQYEIPKSLQDVFGVSSNKKRDYDEKIGNLYKNNGSSIVTIYDIVTLNLKKCDGEVADTQMLTANTQMFQLIQQYKNPLLNEFWCDLDINGNPVITLREYPYSEKYSTKSEYRIPSDLDNSFRQYFDDLDTVVVDRENWNNLKTGRSSHERFNWFTCTSESHPIGTIINQQAELYKTGGLVIDEESIKKYGLLRFEQGTMYSSFLTGDTKSKSFDTLKNFTNLCNHWFKRNSEFLNGSIRMKNKFDLMLGKKLVIKDIQTNSAGIETHSEAYYVTGVTESWQAKMSANFDVTLVRGRPLTENELNKAESSYEGSK